MASFHRRDVRFGRDVRFSILAGAIFAILAACPGSSAQDASEQRSRDPIVIDTQDSQKRFARVRFDGDIKAGDAILFDSITRPLVNDYDVVELQLNSLGGDVDEAMKIGDLVRKNWMWTMVADDKPGVQCDSACVLIFAAGAERIASGKSLIGIHRPFFDSSLFAGLSKTEAQQKYAGLVQIVRDYLDRMGMSRDLANAMLAVPSNKIHLLTMSELEAFRLVGEDPGYDEWSRARNEQRNGKALVQRQDAWIAQEQDFMHQCAAMRGPPSNEEILLNCAAQFERDHPSPLTQSAPK